jgi:hypothetical protein
VGRGGDHFERLTVGEVSAGFFPLFGVRPQAGRTFSTAEDTPGARLLSAFLFGVTPWDPAAAAAAILALVLVAGIAAWAPARRAARIDPLIALRAE